MQSDLMLRALKKRKRDYYRQKLDDQSIQALANFAAITFRPGGHLDSFEDNLIRRAGIAAMVTLRYQPDRVRSAVPVEIYSGDLRTDGSVCRSVKSLRLSLDLRRRPKPGGRGRVIDPVRNPSLLDTAVRLHQRCRTVLGGNSWPQNYVVAPSLLLGFAPKSPPNFEDTQALREHAAIRLGVRIGELGRNGSVLLDRYLRDAWERIQLPPDSPENSTGNLLVPARFCPSARHYLNTFEDFRDFVGVPTWNPARDIRIASFDNPAGRIWQELGFGPAPDFNQVFTEATLAEAECRMRAELGEVGSTTTKEDILDGLTAPDLPFVAWSTELPRLRRKMPSWAEPCCTLADLKDAVRRPEDPLWVRYACRAQVVRRDTLARWLGATDWDLPQSLEEASLAASDEFAVENESLCIAS